MFCPLFQSAHQPAPAASAPGSTAVQAASRPGGAIALATSVATLPLLGGLLLSRWALDGLVALGAASEERFRGDRLPLLNNLDQDLAPDLDG